MKSLIALGVVWGASLRDVSENQKKLFRAVSKQATGQTKEIQIFDMDHAYNMNEWLDSLSDMKLLAREQDVRLPPRTSLL